MIMKIVPINMRIVLTHVIKIGISFWVWWKVNWNWLEFFSWQKATVEQMLELKEVNKSIRAKFWESQSGIQVEKLAHINKDGDR